MADNILLPIHPIFAQKILDGEKRYEYRKKLCKKDVKKLYLYATAPQKCIVGEAEILEKIYIGKKELWERSGSRSGITYEQFAAYFQKSEKAGAYFLGNVKKYDAAVKLEDVGIHYPPQSFLYVSDIL